MPDLFAHCCSRLPLSASCQLLPIAAVGQMSSLAKRILHGVVLLGLLWMFPFLSTLFCKLKLRTWCCCCCSWCCWFSLLNTRCGHYRKFLSANLFFIPLAHEAQLMALSKVNTKKCKFFFQWPHLLVTLVTVSISWSVELSLRDMVSE